MNKILLGALGLAALSAVVWADPPGRVGRLSYVEGSVSFSVAAGEKWQAATVNYPLTTGNMLSTSTGARAEVQIGSSVVLLAPDTGISFQALDDQGTQIRLDKGTVSVRLRRLSGEQGFEVDTQTASVSLKDPGNYRIDQAASGDAAVITRQGDAAVTGGDAAFNVGPGQKADIPASGPDSHRISAASAPDPWDQWVAQREGTDDKSASTRYVSSEMDGVDDLDGYGSWTIVAGYGPVWFPAVTIGWAPYTFGHWVWIDPWGWTWVDDEPWGFAPFHYGRWAFITGAWCWVPGPIVARPVFAPALVRWVGGTPWRGHPPGQLNISWAPLGPRQVFHPPYSVSTTYFRAVNGGVLVRPSYGGPRMATGGLASRPPWVPGGGPLGARQRPLTGPLGVAGYPDRYPGGLAGQASAHPRVRQEPSGQDTLLWPSGRAER